MQRQLIAAILILLLTWSPKWAAGALATTPDLSSPKSALKALSAALHNGDRAAALAIIYSANSQDAQIAAVTVDLAEATAALREAALKAFGKDGAAALVPDAAGASEAVKRIDSATETYSADRKTVTLRAADSNAPIAQMVQINGNWCLPISDLAKDLEGDVEQNLRQAAAQIKAVREIAAQVSAGKFKTAIDARVALDGRAMGPAGTGGGTTATAPATLP